MSAIPIPPRALSQLIVDTTIATPASGHFLRYNGTKWVNTALVVGDIPSLSGTYQPLDADLTSWAAVTRGAGFDTFAAAPTVANLNTALGSTLVTTTTINNATLPGSFTTGAFSGATTLTSSPSVNSTSALLVSGVPRVGTGSGGTTSFPLVYINDANATASTTLNTAGTYFGVNGTNTQDLMNLLKNGTSMVKVSSAGLITTASSLVATTNVQSKYFTDAANTVAYMDASTDSTHAWTLFNQTATKVPLTIRGASAQSANLFETNVNGGSAVFSVSKDGNVAASGTLAVTGATTEGGSAAGAATTQTRLVKSVSSIADNTATTCLTITISNASHNGSLRVRLLGILGAGNIAAGEASADISYDINFSRTTGLASVAAISTGYAEATSNVAGGNTVTVTAAITASGSNTTTNGNVWTLDVTIARTGAMSTSHTCKLVAEILNANASGILIS